MLIGDDTPGCDGPSDFRTPLLDLWPMLRPAARCHDRPMTATTGTTIAISRADRLWAIALGAGAGLALGLALPVVWTLVDDVNWIPFHGPLELIMSMHVTGVAVLRPLMLAAVGALLMTGWSLSQPRLTLHDDHIVITEKGTDRVIPRDQVAGAYLKGSKVIIETAQGRHLFDSEIEGAKKTAGPAFQAHGYPWETRA